MGAEPWPLFCATGSCCQTWLEKRRVEANTVMWMESPWFVSSFLMGSILGLVYGRF